MKVTKLRRDTPTSELRIKRPQRKIALPTTEGIYFEKVKDIVSLSAEGNYTNIFKTDGRVVLVSKTLAEVEKMLRRHPNFVRIHRSFTVNLDLIVKYNRGKGGSVETETGSVITVSAGRKQDFLTALQRYFG